MYDYGIYVHIPFCKARCHYCAFSSCCDYSLQERYFAKLRDEISARGNKDVSVSTIYLGGGTPSSVNTEYLNNLFAALRDNFDLSSVCEITVECNPESVNDNLLARLKGNGVNRLSFGLQSVNDETLRRIGRIHRYEDFTRAVESAQKYGFENINADLILGLPESIDDFRRSVKVVSSLPLTHVSVYALELHEDSPVYSLCKTKYNYSDDELADMYDYALSVLSHNGFKRYEISNFAKAGYECRHNLIYWTENRYFAFGASASGFAGDARYTNPYGIKEYMNTPIADLLRSGEQISLNDQANEYAMLGLRLGSGVSLHAFKSRFLVDFFDFFENANKLVEQGLLVVKNGFISVPEDKIYVINSILCDLLTFENAR